MNISKNTMLIIVVAVIVVLFLYFGNGTMMNTGMNGRMNGSGWLGGHGWGWFPTIVTLLLGVVIGWLLFKKKN